ncbi:hypothetical protein MCNF_52890 [Mycolicibacterium confluentis]|uniref:DUF732 domain-containing protein n=2 Tax=Mycolicibacterium confluentis TaxID=28047 RepID=A0A7I7Y5W7_9MYCO|nr:hypothetical protein MCNF_52890 [Mycolicibacterium confluentis]
MQNRASLRAGGRTALMAGLSLLIAVAGVALVCGCTPGEHVMKTAGVPHHPGGAPGPGTLPALAVPDPAIASNFSISAEQRAYLDALKDEGVYPSSDLLGLSIGSYICQAHAAGQNDQAVRDFVLPLVRGDIRGAQPGVAVTSLASQVDDVTSTYMRVATDRLC